MKTPALVLIAVVVVLATASSALNVWQLVAGSRPQAGYDLRELYRVTRLYVDGVPIYETVPEAMYPPASWLLLWPTYGWVSIGQARWIWCLMDLSALAALGIVFARLVAPLGSIARTCAALAPFSMPALGLSLELGQTSIVALTLAVGAILLAVREHPTWISDAAAAAMFDLALVKPSVMGPFFVPLLVVPARRRPAVLAVLGYAALTLAAITFQESGPIAQIRGWLHTAQTFANAGHGYGNVAVWLLRVGWQSAALVAAGVLLMSLAIFTRRYEHVDVWIVIGVAAIVARLWTYHFVYDDGILILALMGVARVTATPHSGRWFASMAGTTLIICALILWMPVAWHYTNGGVKRAVFFDRAHVIAMMLMLVVFAVAASLQSTNQRRHAVIEEREVVRP